MHRFPSLMVRDLEVVRMRDGGTATLERYRLNTAIAIWLADRIDDGGDPVYFVERLEAFFRGINRGKQGPDRNRR